MPTTPIKWAKVRAKLTTDEWYQLGVLPKTTYEAIRQGKMTAMRGVEVKIRDSFVHEGRKYGTIYLRLES